MIYKKYLPLIGLLFLLTGCDAEEEEVIDPQTFDDCKPINDLNKREQCLLKLKAKGLELRKESLGSSKFGYKNW